MKNRTNISTGSGFEQQAGYSRAVVQGDWCFVSGTTGYHYPSLDMPTTIEEQTENCLKTIAGVLEKASFTMHDIVRIRYYIVDAHDADRVFPIVGKWFAESPPAATMIVCDLIRPEMKIEIEATALKSSD